jgi:putative salt-induced outer membrane protein
MRTTTSILVLVLAAFGGSRALAEEKPTKLSLGLSYLATSGNTQSQTGGVDLLYKCSMASWGIQAGANYLRAKQNGDIRAERLLAGLRGSRVLSTSFDVFVATSYLKDRFAGLDPRWVTSAGAAYKLLKGPTHALAFDLGFNWTKDQLVTDGSKTYAGGLVATHYAWSISKTAKLTEDLAFYPSFENRNNWRLESKAELQTAVSTAVALKLTHSLRYANRPVEGYRKTDTQTAASLVINFL